MRFIFYTVMRNLFIVGGHDIFRDGGLKRNWYSYLMYVITAVPILSSIYTIVTHDAATGLNSCSYMAIGLQVYTPNKILI